jgi:hypothetical protein
MLVGLMRLHKLLERSPRNVLQNLLQNAIVVPHALDLLPCPKRR